MEAQLFKHLNGLHVKFGTPDYEQEEVIEEVISEEGWDYVQVVFEGGEFTCIPYTHFDYFLQEGAVRYKWGGETLMESLEDIE